MSTLPTDIAKREASFANLIANGRLFTGIRRPNGFRQMMRKNCFRNAQILAVEGRATYVEGICVARSVPWIGFAHAWLTLDGEHAVDITLDAQSHVYFGIAFEDKCELARAICKAGYYQSRLSLDTVMDVPPELAEAIEPAKAAAEKRAADKAKAGELN
jgi:hypothetical protein